MVRASCTATIQAAHTDIAASQSALVNGFLAGGPTAVVNHMKKSRKVHHHANGPHCHANQGGTPSYNKDMRWKIGRQGDYLTSSWLRVELGAVQAATALLNSGAFLRYTHNLGHNLLESVEITFSGVPGATFDDFYLDFFSAFSVPAGKRNAYDNMIGNLPELVNPIVSLNTSTANQILPAAVLNIPLPMPYCRDIGISLPTGGLIYNEVLIEACIRDWTELLVVSNGKLDGTATAAVGGGAIPANSSRAIVRADVEAVPEITDLQLWGNYAVVTSDERKRMGKQPRDMIWEIIQTASSTSIQSVTASTLAYLRYSHAVKCLFFACRNTTVTGDRSNYTSRGPLTYSVASGLNNLSVTEFPAPNAFDPIASVTLKYEGTDRVVMDVDYFSLIVPYYTAYAVPTVTGYHVFSYSSNFISTDSLGCVDYGKLTNVSAEVTLSADALLALAGAVIPTASLPFKNELGAASALPPGYLALTSTANVNAASGFNAQAQKYELLNASLAHTVVRAIGGGIGFPIF